MRPARSPGPADIPAGADVTETDNHEPLGLAADIMGGWNGHNGIQMAGALAFFGALSAAPLIVVAAAAASVFFSRQGASGELVAQLTPIIGAGAAKGLESAAAVALSPERGLMATVVAVVGTLFGAAGVVVQMRTSLDMILGRDEIDPLRGALGDWLSAGTAVFAIGVAAVLTLVAWALVSSVTALGGGPLGALAEGTASTVVFFGLLVLGYRLLPSRRPAWERATVGAAVATLVAIVATVGMSIYLATGFASSVYGAAASFFVFLMWMWFIGIGFIVGAETIRALGERESAA